jgi:hypothetical protein
MRYLDNIIDSIAIELDSLDSKIELSKSSTAEAREGFIADHELLHSVYLAITNVVDLDNLMKS